MTWGVEASQADASISANSVLRELTATETLKPLRYARFFWLPAVASETAPLAFATWTAASPSPPTPDSLYLKQCTQVVSDLDLEIYV